MRESLDLRLFLPYLLGQFCGAYLVLPRGFTLAYGCRERGEVGSNGGMVCRSEGDKCLVEGELGAPCFELRPRRLQHERARRRRQTLASSENE